MAEEAKVVREDNAKLKVDLQRQLQVQQIDLQAFQQKFSTKCGKVISLEEKLRATEKKILEAIEREATSREVAIEEAKQ